MAGGKETPRQKMIGMMYLVLMAMLALNVSKTIIDAFIAIEENIQISSQNEHARGLEKIEQLDEQAKSGDTPEVRAKAKKLLIACNEIDKITAAQIKYLDALKMEILTEIKEEPGKLKPGGPESIITTAFDPKFPLRPIRMNLNHVTNKDKYDESMRIFGIADNPNKPIAYKCKSSNISGGIELWNNMLKFRGDICSALVKSSSNDTVKYKFEDPKIIKYKDLADLQKQVSAKFKKDSKIDPEDYTDVEKIYISLTKNEHWEDKEHPEGLHWLGKTFNHSPSVAAIASLSSLQKEILTARADAISAIRARLGAGEYSFNKIVGLAFPETAVLNPGDQFEVTVMMAAFDSDKQPIVKPGQGSVVKVADGRATLKLTAPSSGDMIIKGVVGIANKRGEIKEMPYETKIQVATKAGSISLPELNVLYTDWDNKVVAVASGVLSTSISAPGAQVVPTTIKGQKGFIVKVSPSQKEVNISLSGKDAKGKSISFGSTKYKVKPFPKPRLTIDKISKSSNTRMRVSLGPDSPLGDIEFDVTGGAITIGPDRIPFNGPLVPSSLMAKAKVGRDVVVSIDCKRKGSNKPIFIKGGLEVIP
jgi:hypothetical protein